MTRPSVAPGAQASAWVGTARVAWLDRQATPEHPSRCATLLALWPRAADGSLIAVPPRHRAEPLPQRIIDAVASYEGEDRRWIGVVTLHGPEWRERGPALVAQIESLGWSLSDVCKAVIDLAAGGDR